MEKCLVVDDDLATLEVLADFVETLGFQSLKARDGDDAWAVFKREIPELVITDIHMPHRNGLLLMYDIKNYDPDIPVILISGHFSLHYLKIQNGTQPDGYIEKPFTLTDLQQAIEKAMPMSTDTLAAL